MAYAELAAELAANPRTWLVTGLAGFIGSNLLERLLELGQKVKGLDSFATGHAANLEDVRQSVGEEAWAGFTMIEGDIADPDTCAAACQGVDAVLHQAALGSVPRSIEHPLDTNESNITGFVNMLEAARKAGATSFVYASSSSIYGDHPDLPKREDKTGEPLSPYALTKSVNEQYARVYNRVYGFKATGLRYFNIFGRRQDPEGAYAAVIPKWFAALLTGGTVHVNGDGETSRDFCYIENVIQANLQAAMAPKSGRGEAYNIAFGERITLNELFAEIRDLVASRRPELAGAEPVYRDFRPGDVRHSLADISKARELIGYDPGYSVHDGLRLAAQWYMDRLG
jgi:UDP-N-acetylglucosamine 4-epimerase